MLYNVADYTAMKATASNTWAFIVLPGHVRACFFCGDICAHARKEMPCEDVSDMLREQQALADTDTFHCTMRNMLHECQQASVCIVASGLSSFSTHHICMLGMERSALRLLPETASECQRRYETRLPQARTSLAASVESLTSPHLVHGAGLYQAKVVAVAPSTPGMRPVPFHQQENGIGSM
jgi:hypothetical protein